MQFTKLGRTGLKVSIAGLGGGGHSRLGLSKNLGENNAINIVKSALDLGINIFDTSSVYDTEEAVGKGIAHTARNEVVISTKFPPREFKGEIKSEGALTKSLENSLKNLNMDYIDVLHLHAVLEEDYITVRDRFMPELIKAKEAGKIGWFGITEMFGRDTNHKMLEKALEDDIWDVVMVGYNLINFSAQKKILPLTKKHNVGTLLMFAVRNALSNKDRLKEVLAELSERGEIDISKLSEDDPLDFLSANGIAKSTVDAAYRFCRHSDGIDVVLSGTSSVEHLKENAASILSERLPVSVEEKIYNLFSKVDSVSAG